MLNKFTATAVRRIGKVNVRRNLGALISLLCLFLHNLQHFEQSEHCGRSFLIALKCVKRLRSRCGSLQERKYRNKSHTSRETIYRLSASEWLLAANTRHPFSISPQRDYKTTIETTSLASGGVKLILRFLDLHPRGIGRLPYSKSIRDSQATRS